MTKSRRRKGHVSPEESPTVLPVEVMDEMWRSLTAESEGDAARAIEHFRASPLADSAPHLRYLLEIDDLGEDAPGWVWSRWVLQQAFRWLFLTRDQRLYDAALVAIGTFHSHLPLDDLGDAQAQNFVTEVVTRDWMVRQLALYGYGGLRDYVDAMASPALLRRADRVLAWSAKPIGAYRIDEAVGTRATLTDLPTGVSRDVLNLGFLAEGVGEHVVGRLVPIRSEPRWMFDSRPRNVSRETAELVVAAGTETGRHPWVRALGEAVDHEGMEWPLDVVACLGPLSTDMVGYTWGAANGELSEPAFEVCNVSLRTAGAGDLAASLAAPYISAVLFDSQIYSAARARLARPEHAAAWEALARMTHEPVRTRWLCLAEAARAAA
jgi:hypothetical protein